MYRRSEELSFGAVDCHQLYIDDNLQVLKYLQGSYKGRIRVIYLDPPYGDLSHDKVFTVYSHCQEGEFYSFFKERVVLCKELLSENGTLWVSMDFRNLENVLKICNEVFGKKNYVENFIRITHHLNGRCLVNSSHEYLVCYAKNRKKIDLSIEYSKEEILKRFNNRDEKGFFVYGAIKSQRGYTTLVKNPLTGQERLYKRFKFSERRFKEICEGKDPYRAIEFLPYKVDEKRNFFKYKYYYNEKIHKRKKMNSLQFTDKKYCNFIGTQWLKRKGLDFPYCKPLLFMYDLLNYATDKESIILDLFGGSGVTGAAVMLLNGDDNGKRRFIMCQRQEVTDIHKQGIPYEVTISLLRSEWEGLGLLKEDVGVSVFLRD